MTPGSILPLAAMVVALSVGAPAASARVDLAGGSTTLKLTQGTARALESKDVAVVPLQPARERTGGVAFPIAGGSIDPAGAAGRIDHSGGLAFAARRTRVALRGLRVQVGARRVILTARLGTVRLTVLSLPRRRVKVRRDGVATTVTGVRAVLSRRAARALNAAFDASLFARGREIGTVTVRAEPAEVEFAGGATALALDAGAAGALESLGIAAAPVEPATGAGGGLSFPITGGKADAETFAGSLRHSGGIRLSRGDTAVELASFTVNVDTDPDVTALVGGRRESILRLDLSQLAAQVSGRRITLSGVRASLTAAAAQALNQAFATSAFGEGLVLGTATVAARVR